MGLMISSIAKIGKNIMPKSIFNKNSDYYLYILEYSDFDLQETHNYSSELHSSGMSRILNNYEYYFNNSGIEKLKSATFHSNTIMSYQNIFDIENLNFEETRPAKITPAFLFTTIQPDHLNKINFDNISNEEFIFLKIKHLNRDANRIPQIANEMLSNTGLTVSKCKRSSIQSNYKNIYVFDYCSETPTTKVADIKKIMIMGDNIEVGNISNNSGQITLGKDNKTEVNPNDKLSKKSYNWQKWGLILTTILTIIAIITQCQH